MSTLTLEALQQLTGYSRPADVARCLRRQGITVFHGKDGPFTTTDLINAAGGLAPAANADEPYNPDMVA